MIDENGYSILQRLPATSSKEHLVQSDKEVVSDVIHFQRGSVDVFTFEGPKLQKIIALWISPESGQYCVQCRIFQHYRSLNAFFQNGNIGEVLKNSICSFSTWHILRLMWD